MSSPPRPIAVVAFPLAPEALARIEAVAEVRHADPRDAGALAAALADADGLLCSNQLVVDDALLDAAPRLRVVSGFGVGYDKFDVDAATARGVALCNTPGVLSGAVADLTIALILAAARRLVDHAGYVRGGGWARREAQAPLGFDVAGKTLGLVGFGRIGREVARRARPFDMRVVYHDVRREVPDGFEDCTDAALDDLLSRSDIVSLHVDLNPDTHHLIGTRELGLMKPSAWLVNTSRGPVVDQAALTEALRSGAIAGAALDVIEVEPPADDEPLLALPNVIALPHIGSATVETREAMRDLCVENLVAALSGRKPPACVNPEVLAAR